MNKYFLFLILFIFIVPVSLAQHNMRFFGALVSEPCVIKEEDALVELDFGAIPNKIIYDFTRTRSLPFTIKLSDCDLNIATLAEISFIGQENLDLPGFLAITSEPELSGFAIGLETESGNPININESSSKQYPLLEGDNQFDFKAFIQGEPLAIQNQSLKIGPFKAMMVFKITYE